MNWLNVDVMSVGAILSSAYKVTFVVEIVFLACEGKNHSYRARNGLLRESWFCERVMLRIQGTVFECVTSCMVIVLEGCGFKATGESKRLNGDWSPLLFELVARTKLNF